MVVESVRRRNIRSATKRFGSLTPLIRQALYTLTDEYSLLVCSGDIVLLDNKWYVTNSGLLRVARNNRCNGIHTEIVAEFSDPIANRWVIKAKIFKTPRSKGFVGYGDADPSNVSPLVRGAELRIAETRAVNRALRKAYGIGICSVEELGSPAGHPGSYQTQSIRPSRTENGGSSRAGEQPSLRDRLLLLIRQNQLDAEQVKRYALQFCGTARLREASREQIEQFVEHLASLAASGSEQLTAKIKAGFDRRPTVSAETNPCSSNSHANSTKEKAA
jgi:hypothetical protein